MPTCSALGCSVRSVKGQLSTLKIFPRKDKNRRKIWIERVKRPGWTPSRHSVLCELHFDSDQWEVGKEDRKRKLKKTAVPTVFHVAQYNHLVSIDHTYCQTGLRKIYGSTDAKTFKSKDVEKGPRKLCGSTSKKNENFSLPEFEHVDVNVDEHSIYTPEFANLESEEIDNQVRVKEEPEDIQCTPDICMWPEPDEPDPIEMVDCCDGEINPFENEPCNDPLAISADDMLNMKGIVPNFAHARKFLFVPKDTKPLPASVSRTATGEPLLVASAEEPRIKVISPQRLLLPKPPSHLSFKTQKLCVVPTHKKVNVVLPYAVKTSNINNEPSSVVSSPPKIQLIPTRVLNETPEKTIVATYLRKTPPLSPPKLTPAPSFGKQSLKQKNDVVKPPEENVEPVRSLNLLSSSNPILNAPLPKLQEAPMFRKVSDVVKRNSSDTRAPLSNAKPVTQISLKSSLSKMELQPSSVTSDTMSLMGKKGIINFNANNVRLSQLSKHLGNKKVLFIKNKKLTRPIIIHRQKNVDSSDHVKKMAFLKSMENFAQLENISLEHEYASNLSWKPLSFKGFKLKEDSLHSYCGTKLYPLTKNYDTIRSENGSLKPDNNDCNGSSNKKIGICAKRISQNLFRPSLAIPVFKSSSLLVVNSFDKTKAIINLKNQNNNDITELPPLLKIKKENKVTEELSLVNQNMINTAPLNISHLKLYKCDMCKFSFLTPASLQIHSDSHGMSKLSERKGDLSDTDTASTVTPEEPEDDGTCGNSIILNCQIVNTKMKENSLDNPYGRPILGSESGGSSNSEVGIPHAKTLKELKETLKNQSLKLKVFKGSESTNLPLLQSNSTKKSLKEDENNYSQESSVARYSLRRKNTPLSPKPSMVKKRRSKRCRVKTIYAQKDKKEKALKKNPIVPKSKLRKKAKSSESVVPVVAKCNKVDRIIAEIKKEKVKSLRPNPKTRAESLNKSKNQTVSNLSKNKKPKPNNSSNVNTKCPTCGMEVKKSDLNCHMMQHISVDINLYTCTLCNKKFSMSHQLRRHITCDHKVRTTSKDFKCPKKYCDRAFESKRMLYKHTLISHKK